ncbi:hypothetical protein NQ314_005974 [Rhamnusium bicolor]|uniref:Transcription factor CBF/NF-Y/archaeal histone domain-containing protein n=1 Tax=Rhamnusium bicolor TaxID=1586634 RepID=A0AAV8ZB53_9CUCU|nr:hypothetical protein NQ314_005974 [Rhamnusium bicolor]
MEEIEVHLDSSTNGALEDHNTESVQSNGITSKTSPIQRHKFVRLPLARVKAMMKKDPTCALISQDAVFLVTKATEMFIEYLAKESGKHLGASKRKTVMKRDIDCAIESSSHLCFLDGALE